MTISLVEGQIVSTTACFSANTRPGGVRIARLPLRRPAAAIARIHGMVGRCILAFGVLPATLLLGESPQHSLGAADRDRRNSSESRIPATIGARGRVILNQVIETNRYWLMVPPEAITNYSYVFHYYDWAAGKYDQTSARVSNPMRAPRTKRQAYTYSSLLHFVALNPSRIEIKKLTEDNRQIVLELAVVPQRSESSRSPNGPARDVWPAIMRRPKDDGHVFGGVCGNGIEETLYGGFGFMSGGGEVVIDAAKIVPIKSVARMAGYEAVVEETFANYTEVRPGYLAPLSIHVVSGPMQFELSFKVHPGGLWLFDQSQYQGKKSAYVEDLRMNQPGLARDATNTEEKIFSEQHVQVTVRGIGDAYAKAIARTLAAARSIAVAQFGFDMPEVITMRVTADPASNTVLFNDGSGAVTMRVRSEAGLARPSRSGVCTIYGICHEVGHIAMCRLMMPTEHEWWIRRDAAEAWAHYFGSRVTDSVYEQCGAGLWPDAYDYRAEGMKRLNRQLADKKAYPAAETQTAGQWKALVQIVGDKGVAPVFRGWAEAKPTGADPSSALRLKSALANLPAGKRLAEWWTNAAPELLRK